MTIIKINKNEWNDGLKTLNQSYRLMGPVKEGDAAEFAILDDNRQPDFDFQNSRLSPKALVHPQSQIMFTYSLDDTDADHHILKEPEKDLSARAVLGIRPCDAAAFLLVRRNFETPEYNDPYWLNSYAALTLVGLACQEPCSTCFCKSAGSGPFNDEGLDILLVADGDSYLAKPVTDKGRALMGTANWETAANGGEEKISDMKQAAEAKITSQVETDQLKNKSTLDLYEAPFWEDTAFACINCGTCTYLCPTCWCFDIQDENRGKSGVRMRNWDSCMYPIFSLHGSGHNPRGEKMHRLRQRFMHKLKYYVDKYDDGIQCVGCGRCIQYCPVNIDIRTVCSRMNSFGATGTACEIS